MTENRSIPIRICPHLGAKYDPGSAATYASSQNYCHHGKAPAAPSIETQRTYCLVTLFTECPVYLGPGTEPFPAGLVNPQKAHSSGIKGLLSRLRRKLRRLFTGNSR